MAHVDFYVSDATQGEALRAQLSEQLGVTAELRPAPPNHTIRRSEGLQVIQLILTIPISTLATLTLVERIQVGDALVRLREWALANDIHAWMGLPGQPPLPLETLDPGVALDAANEE